MKTLIVILLLSFVCLVHCRGPRLPNMITSNLRSSKVNNKRMINETNIPPSRGPMEDDLYEIQHAFMFPGSNYLIDLLKDYVSYMMENDMDSVDMKDFFQFPECDIKDLMSEWRKVSRVVEDTDVVALYATRMLMKPILNERMRCPANVVDVAIAKALMNIREHYTDNEDSSWYKMFMDILPQLDSQLQPYVQDIANKGVDELHGYLFDQSIELLFTFGLRDVAFTSHRLYDNLRGYFDMEDMYPQDRENMLKESVRMSLWDIWCPVSYEIIENHRKIVMMFKNEFEMIEQMHICPKVADFLYRYIDNNLPWYNATFENTQGFWMLCDLVGDIVKETVEGYKDYENFLSTMNIGDLESVLQKYLTDEDWKIFTEALRRLGFFDTNVVRSLGRISSKWLKRK